MRSLKRKPVMGRSDEHIIEAIGRTRVVVRNGEVVDVGNPLIRGCPLARRFAVPVHEFTREAIKENILHRIRAFGMCTPDRVIFDDREFVGFGASEILSSALDEGSIDAVVIPCDGAGTVIVTDPRMVQGIGGRMSGLVRTCPYSTVMDRIENGGGIVLDREGAAIDQMAGLVCAREHGYRRIAVTITDGRTSAGIRRLDGDALIVAVHLTGIGREDAETIANTADLVTPCASAVVREVAGRRAKIQAGASIPVFAMTDRGKDILIGKIRHSERQILIRGATLPLAGEEEPDPLI
ncbi:MAG: methanogenesis marker 8 protein [Methanoculleaceae archaeon]